MASVIPAARSFAAPLIPGHYEAGSWSNPPNPSVNHAMRGFSRHLGVGLERCADQDRHVNGASRARGIETRPN